MSGPSAETDAVPTVAQGVLAGGVGACEVALNYEVPGAYSETPQ